MICTVSSVLFCHFMLILKTVYAENEQFVKIL